MSESLLTKLDKLPPFVVRILARHQGKRKALSTAEIAAASKLSEGTVKFLSRQRSWAKIKVDVAVRFSQACGVDLIRQKRHREYLRVALQLKGGLAHIKNSPNRDYLISLIEGQKKGKKNE